MEEKFILEIRETNSLVSQYKTSEFFDIDTQKNVQAFINNISVPKSLDELEFFIDEHGCYNVEDILQESSVEWTSPRWTKIGDIVFFMHAKTARTGLTALRTQLNTQKAFYSKKRYDEIMEWIERGLFLHSKYGGKIFAIAKVCGMPEYWDAQGQIYHWGSHIYAAMDNICILDNPVDISEFNHQIMVSRQSGITPIFGNDFELLRKLICNKNKTPRYFRHCEATPIPYSKINADNWFSISNEYRRSFMLEIQFRNYYVNYLLKNISDIKTIYRECRCRKKGIADSFIDNVILFNEKYLPVEIKLCIKCDNNIKQQVAKYCYDDYIILDANSGRKISGEKVIQNRVLVIDTEDIYIYKAEKDVMEHLFSLDLLRSKSDIVILIKNIKKHI